MKPRTFSIFVLCAMLLGRVCLAHNQTSQTTAALQFTLLREYAIVIPVTVNGRNRCEFLLDTGASTTILSQEFARKLRLRPLDRLELVTPTGSQLVVRSHLDQLTVGSKTATQLEVLWSDLQEVRTLKREICGVLGQNFLAQFNYLLDYQTRQLIFEDDEELAHKLCGQPVPLIWHEGRPLISAVQAGKKEAVRLVLDSGTPMLWLFEPKPAVNTTSQPWLVAASDAGRKLIQSDRLPSLRLGGLRFTNVPVIRTAATSFRQEDGLLPTNLFQAVYFNHRQGVVIFNPQAIR
ncbi:MAG: retropepsin-like aspartic protease [Acidobacteriota bacterium]